MIEGLVVVILSFNEERRIARCVQSVVGIAQTLIVLDSGSTDSTLEIITKTWKQSGRRVTDLWIVSQKWRGFLQTRNESLQWAKCHKWVLWLDSDEWLSPELCEELEKKLSNRSSTLMEICFRIPRLSFYREKAIRHSGWFPDKKFRLGVRDKVFWKPGPDGAHVHEDLFPIEGNRETQFVDLKGFIFHEPFLSLAEHRDTNERYALLLAEAKFLEMKRSGKIKKPGNFYIFIKGIVKFLENYIFKLGFLDGFAGFVICWESARGMKRRLRKIAEHVDSLASPS